MTPNEFTDRTGHQLVLRCFLDSFLKCPGGMSVAVKGKWSASIGQHYYTTDSCRLVGTERDGSEVGWGETPDAAVSDLASLLLKKADGMRRHLHAEAEKHDTEYNALEAALSGGK